MRTARVVPLQKPSSKTPVPALTASVKVALFAIGLVFGGFTVALVAGVVWLTRTGGFG
jgi:hypothetical protein